MAICFYSQYINQSYEVWKFKDQTKHTLQSVYEASQGQYAKDPNIQPSPGSRKSYEATTFKLLQLYKLDKPQFSMNKL